MSFCVLLFVVSLSGLVLGDANHKWEVTSLKFENKDNEYFGKWSGNFENGKGSAKINIDFASLQEIAEEALKVNMLIEMPGHEPIKKIVAFPDALEDKTMGESFVLSVIPKDILSKKWPLPKNSFSAKNWSPSMNSVPMGTEGPVLITAGIGLEDEEPFATITGEIRLFY